MLFFRKQMDCFTKMEARIYFQSFLIIIMMLLHLMCRYFLHEVNTIALVVSGISSSVNIR